MDLIKKLQILMNNKEIKNIAQLSRVANIPYTTLKSIFDGDVNDVRLSTSRKLCDYFKITLDDLLDDDIELGKSSLLSNELNEKLENNYGSNSIYLLNNYARLNELGKQKANENIYDLTQIPKYTEKKETPQKANG